MAAPVTSVAFHIGHVAVDGDVIFAPMAGFADVPTRAVYRSHGSALSYSEFVAVEEIIGGSDRAFSLLDFSDDDRPMAFQLFGNDAQRILQAALKVQELGPDIIDINMGCSTRRVSGRGAGVGMMRDPSLISETFELLCKHLAVPVTGKLRLGWDDNQNYLEVARILEESGAAAIALHPRTKEQKYGGEARWDAIAEVRAEVTIPVIGNGDIVGPKDIERMKAQTGCQAVMVGRGGLGNPWLLGRVDKAELCFSLVVSQVVEHLQQMVAYYGQRGVVLFRKHLKHYLGEMAAVEDHLQTMVRARAATEVFAALEEAEQEFGSLLVRELRGQSSAAALAPEPGPH